MRGVLYFAAGFMLVKDILLPLLFLWLLWKAPQRGKLDRMITMLFIGSYILMIMLTSAWNWLGYYWRILLPIAYLAVVVRSIRTWTFGSRFFHRKRDIAFAVVKCFLTPLFILIAVIALAGRSIPEGEAALELSFPMKGGLYYIHHGGSQAAVNYHVSNKAQKYALDISRLNALGTRAWGIYPKDHSRYQIFGDELYSPCDGKVLHVETGSPDMPIGDMDSEHPGGNLVVLGYEDYKIAMCHLMKDSVAVTNGQVVKEGALLGKIGNSGNTSEPHLHIHAAKGGAPDSVLDGEGVPIRFHGRFLVRNSLIRGK